MARSLIRIPQWIACLFFVSMVAVTTHAAATEAQSRTAKSKTASSSKPIHGKAQKKPTPHKNAAPPSSQQAKAVAKKRKVRRPASPRPSAHASDDSNAEVTAHIQQPVLTECGDASSPGFQACITKPRIWWQHSLAAVATGLDKDGKRVGRKYWIAVAGPAPFLNSKNGRPVLPETYRKQASVLNSMVADIIRSIDKDVPRPRDAIRTASAKSGVDVKEALKSSKRAVSDQVSRVLHGAALDLRLELEILKKLDLDPERFSLVVFDLRCEEAKRCVYFADDLGSDDPRFDRYAKLRIWAEQNNATTLHRAYRLKLGDGNAFALEPYDNVASSAHPWPAEVDNTLAAQEFERLVNQRRAETEPRGISFAAAETLKLSARSVLKVADIVDTPSLVLPLNRATGEDGLALNNISDEFARTRLLECQRLRGASSVTEVRSCSGYVVDSKTLAACARGGLCAPSPIPEGAGHKLEVDLLYIAPRESIGKLAAGNAFPRYELGQELAAMKTIEACLDASKADTVKTVDCIQRKTTNDTGRKILDCLKSASLDSAKDRAAKCASDELDTKSATQLACLKKSEKSAVGVIACIDGAGMNSHARHALQCHAVARRGASQDEFLRCIATDAQLAAQCVDRARGQDGFLEAAICASEAQGVPPQLRVLADCYRDPARRDSGTVAECVLAEASKTIGGDGAKIAACAIESNYDALSTAICVAGQQFTRDQRIFLQCVAESAGEPLTSSTCTVGRLAVKELQNCKGKAFGEDDCFGPNNDLRKISQRLGLPIGPNSVVADIVNLQLRVLDFVPLAEVQGRVQAQMSAMVANQIAIIELIRKGDLIGAAGGFIQGGISRITLGLVNISF